MTGKWFDRLVIVILENHGWSQVQDCQFVKWFRDNGVIFSDWCGHTHPSGPNYRALFSGLTWSGNEYDGVKRPNIGDSVSNVTLNYRGTLADRHNPFKDMQAGKRSLYANVGMPTQNEVDGHDIVYLGMDDSNNSHSGSLQQADQNVMEAIADYQAGKFGDISKCLLVVTFDEGWGLDYFSNHVFMGMLPPKEEMKRVNGFTQVNQRFTHRDFALGLYSNWNIPHPMFEPSRMLDRPWWE